ncbi:nucleotidyltransferase/DNA polymerase involved in DNA repair [Bradyrhizobium sp. RT4b]
MSDLIFVKPRFEVYKAVSEQIREIFAEQTPIIEPLSPDEAFLDFTENLQGIPLARDVALETGLNASADIAGNAAVGQLSRSVDFSVPPRKGCRDGLRAPIIFGPIGLSTRVDLQTCRR